MGSILDSLLSSESNQEVIDLETGLLKSQVEKDRLEDQLSKPLHLGDPSVMDLRTDPTGVSRTARVDSKLFADAHKGSNDLSEVGGGLWGGGIQIGDDYQDLAAHQQSTADKWANGLTKMAGKTVINTIGGVGMVGTAIAGLAKWDFKSVYENEFHNSLDDINEWMDGRMPNYVSKEERENNFGQSLLTANFWAGDLFGNAVPFVLGAVLTEVAMTALTAATLGGGGAAQGAATAGIVARATQLLTKAARVSNAVGKTAKGVNVLSKLAALGRGASKLGKAGKLSRQILTGAGYESGVEARQHINTLKDEFTAEFFEENGRAPNDQERAEIQDAATRSANWVFAGNLALVGGGNMLQFPKIFGPGARSLGKKPLGKILRDSVTDPYKAAYKSWSKSRNIVDAGYHALKNPVWEGIIEEGGQGWIDNAGHHNAAKFWARKHNASGWDYSIGMVESLGATFEESYGSKEAWKEIGMGMLIGGIGLPTYARTGKKNKKGKDERKFQMQGGAFEPMRERKEMRARTDKWIEEKGNLTAYKSLKHKFENYSRAVDLQMEQDGALAENDMFTYKNAENDQFFSFISSRLEAGLFTDVVEDIKLVEDMTNEEFVEEFGYTEIATKENWSDAQIEARKKKVVESALAQAQQVKESTDLVDSKFEGVEGWSPEEINQAYTQFAHHLPAGQQTVENLNKVIREQLIHSASTIESVDRRHDEVSERLDEITGGVLREEGSVDLAAQMRKSSMETFGARARAISNALSKNETLEDTDPNKMDEATIAQLNQELGYLQVAIASGMQDNAIDDYAVMEAFEKNNPKEFAKEDVQKEVLGLLRDLRKLNARRQEFVGYYNGLFTKEGQKEALTQVEFFMDEEAAKAKEEQKKEAEDALRDRNLKDFRMFTDGSEFRVNKDLHGDVGYYKWVPDSESVLYNVKDPNDQLNIMDLLQDGANGSLSFKPGRSLLSSIEMEQRKIVEAIENIRTTQPQKIMETQQKVADTLQKIEDIQAQMEIWAKTLAAKKDKSGNIRVAEGSVYQTGENKGKVIPRKAVKRKDIQNLQEELSNSLKDVEQQKVALEEDVATLIANQEVFDKLLSEIQSPGFSQAMPLNERAAYEASLGRNALHDLGVESIINDMAGNTRFKSPAEIMADAAESVLDTEQLLSELGDMISILSTDIENLTEVNGVLQDMILEDDLAHLVQEFEKEFPGVAPTYPAVTKFLNENFRGKDELAHLVDTFSERMFQKMSEVNAAKAEHKLMLDEFYANEELIEKLKQTLAETKAREAALVDLWDAKLKGVEKVQRAITFSKAYQILQDQLGAIYLEEFAALESPIAIQPAVRQSSLTEDGEVERTTENITPPTPKDPPSTGDTNKHSVSLVGWWHSTGVDKTDKNKENYGVKDGEIVEDFMSSEQRRWFKTISELPESELKEKRLIAVTKKTNTFIELVNPEEKIDEFIPGEGIDEHIILVLANEDGTPYRRDGNLVYSSLPITDPKGEKVYFPKTLSTPEQRASFLASRHNDFVKYRQSIINSEVGGVSIPIDGVSRGSNVIQLDSNGKPVFESAVGRITEGGIESIKDIELFVAVPAANKKIIDGVYWKVEGKKLIRLSTGHVYAKYKGRTVHMKRRNLTDTEADIALSLLQGIARGETVAAGTDIDSKGYLKDLLGFRYNTTKSKIYVDTNLDGVEYLIFGPNSIKLRELDIEAEDVSSSVDPNTGQKVISRVPVGSQASIDKVKLWLTTHWHNVNKSKFKKPYVALTMSESDEIVAEEYSSYEEYLMSPRSDILDTPLGVSLVPQSNDVSNTQFRGQNLLFPISSSAHVSAEELRKKSNAKKAQPTGYTTGNQGTDLDALTKAAEDISNPKESGVTTNYKVVNKDGMVVGEEYTLNLTPTAGDAASVPIVLNSEGVIEAFAKDDETIVVMHVLDDLNANLTSADKFSTVFDKLTLGATPLMSTAEIVSEAGEPVINADVKEQGEPLGTSSFRVIPASEAEDFLAGLTPAQSTSEVGKREQLSKAVFGNTYSAEQLMEDAEKNRKSSAFGGEGTYNGRTEPFTLEEAEAELEAIIKAVETAVKMNEIKPGSRTVEQTIESIFGNFVRKKSLGVFAATMTGNATGLKNYIKGRIEGTVAKAKVTQSTSEEIPGGTSIDTLKAEARKITDPTAFIASLKDATPEDGAGTDTIQDLVNSDAVTMVPATQEQRKEEIKWFKKKFPGLPIVLHRGLIDGISHGRAINAAKVVLSDLSVEGTVYHEGVHVVLGRFTTPEARQKLYDAYSRLTGVKVDVEEGMSEEFRNWMIAGPEYVIGKGTKKDQTLLQKFFQALKDFLNLLIGKGPAKDRQQLVEFFQEIQNTTYTKAEPSAYPFKLSQDLKIKLAGTDENLSVEQSRDIIETIVGNMFKVLEAKDSLSVSEFLSLSSSEFSKALEHKFAVAQAEAWNIYKRNVGQMFEPGGYFSDLELSEQQEIVLEFTKIWKSRESVNQAIVQWFNQFEVGLEEETAEESKEFSRQYNIKEVTEVDIKESAPKVVKLLMATLPAPKSSSVNTVYGQNLVDGRPFFNFIQRKLSGLVDFNDQIAALEELVESHDKYGGNEGPIQALIERLKPTKGDALTPGEFQMQRLFRQQFHKFITDDIIALRSTEGTRPSIRLIPAAGERQATQVIARFSANLMTLTHQKKSMFTVNEEGIAVLDTNKKMKIMGVDFTLQEFLDNVETLGVDSVLEGLPYFGINITSPSTLTLDEKQILSDEFLHIIGQLIKRKNVPMIDFFSKESGAFSRLQKIATVEADRSSETLDFSYQSPTGKRMYGVITNTYATNIVGRLNSGKLPNHMLKNGEVKEALQGSIFIDGALSGYQVGLGSLQGVKEESSRRGQDLQDVSPNTLFQTEFISILSGKIPLLASADSKTEFALDLTKRSPKIKGADKSLFSKIPTTEKAFIKQSKLYLRQELVQMKLRAGKGNNSLNSSSLYASYSEASKSLILYEYMVEGNSPLPLGDLATMSVDEFLTAYDAEITSKIQEREDVRREELLQAAINAKIFEVVSAEDGTYVTMLSSEVLENYGISSEKATLTQTQVNKIISAFNRIQRVTAIEQSLIIFGSPGFYTTNNFFKRTKGANGPKKFADVSPEIDSWLKTNTPRKDGKVPDSKVRIVIREDVNASVGREKFITHASSLGMPISDINKKLENPNAKISTKSELIWISSKGYLDYEEGDGSGRASFDEYMELLERVGDVTDPQRAAYAKYVNNIPLTPSEIAIFPVIKPQFFGPSFNSDIYAPMMLKLSVVPMIPNVMRTVASNSALALEADDMLKNKVGLVIFASGAKLGRITDALGKSNPFYTPEGAYSPIQEGFIQEIPYEYFGIQVDMEAKIHTKTVEGAQQRIIRSANIYENGEVVEGKEELQEMDRRVNDLSNETVRSQFEILVDSLGLIEEDGSYKLTEGGTQKFAEIIISEARRRKMGDAYIEGLERFVESPSKVLDLIGNKNRVENLLHSLVANSVVRHKTFGGSKVLVSSSGFEANGSREIADVKATYQDRHLFGANYEMLQFYKKGENGAATTAMEVYLPHYFKELIGENVEVINGNIYSNGELIGGAELLEAYGFRIPTTALNSMEGIIIKGFLPQNAGDAIMVPSEQMVKAGSDFDIDKLTIYLQNYIWNKGTSRLTKVKYLTEENSTTLQRVEQLRQLDPAKYRLLHKNHGDLINLDKHYIRLEKDLRKYKKDLYKINNSLEAKELHVKIDALYEQRKGAARKVKDDLNIEIGLLQSQLINLSVHKEDGNYQLYASLPSKITETLNNLEKMAVELDRVLTLNIENKEGVTIPMQNAQKAIANETLDLSRAMVLHSANYEQLIRPVGTARLKTYAETIRTLKGRDVVDRKKYSMTDFEKMLSVRKEFWTGKAGLEIAAVETLHQIKAQRVGLGVQVSSDFSLPFPSKAISQVIDPETGEVTGSYMQVGSTKDIRGENYISEIIGEFTNAFVDISGETDVVILNINPLTAGVAFSMLRSQVHLSDVALFTSQLGLEDFVNAKMENISGAVDYVLKKYENLSEKVIAELPKSHVPTDVNILWTQRHMSEMLRLETTFIKFREAMNNKVPIRKALAQANKATGMSVTFAELENYINLQESVLIKYANIEDNLSRPITELSQAVVADRSSGSPRSRAHARLIVKRRENLNPASYLNLNPYLEEGVQSGFENALTKTSVLFNDLFMTEKVSKGAKIIDDLIDEATARFMPFADKIKFADLVEHNFTSFVLASIASKHSEAMFKDASRLFQGTETQESLPRRLQALKNSAVGGRFLILQELFPILSTKEKIHKGFGIENIKRFNKKLTQYESNMLSEDFEALMDTDPALGEDLIKFILLQSGTMTSPITWLHLLPALPYAAVVEPIIERYIKDGEQLPLGAFIPQFKKNNISNPIIVPQYKGRYFKANAPRGSNENNLKGSEVRFDTISSSGRSTVSKTMSQYRLRPNEIAVWVDSPITKSEVAEISRRYGEKLDEKGARQKLKDEGKEVGSYKFFVKTKASLEREKQFIEFAASHNAKKDGTVYNAFAKKLGIKRVPPITWEQQPTLGKGIYFKEYGPPGHMSIIRENNIMRGGVDMTGMALVDMNDDTNQLVLPQIVQGNEASFFGAPINETSTLVKLPIFALKGTVISPSSNEWIVSMVNLRDVADKNPTIKFLIPPLGLGFAESGTSDMIESKINDLDALLKSRPNITIVFPEPSGIEALDKHFETVMKQLTCK